MSLTGRKHGRSDLPEDEHIDSVQPVRRIRDVRARHWFMTWNNYSEDSIDVLLAIGGLVKYVIQEETGVGGTPHLQGVLSFREAKLFSTMRGVDSHIHWEVCRNVMAAKNYCSKVETATGKRWVKGYRVDKKVVDPLDGKILYDYQSDIIDMVRGVANDRHIMWYWSDKGAIGKSSLCKHLCMKYDAILVGGKFRDAYYAIADKLKKNGDPDIVIFDIPRFSGNKVSYVAIEGIKNGCFFSSKYEAGMVLYNTPHVIVFANQPPERSALSRDRWVVKCLDSEVDLAHIADQFGRVVRVPDVQQVVTPLDFGGYGNYGNNQQSNDSM